MVSPEAESPKATITSTTPEGNEVGKSIVATLEDKVTTSVEVCI